MRGDMSKVIVERPRRGGSWRRVGRRLPHDEDSPSLPGPREKRRTKGLNENLAPLRRFLERRVGRHWPKVYAEISAQLSPRNAVQQHVRDHLADFVAMRTSKRDGAIWATSRFGDPIPIAGSHFRFYVHPVSFVLMRNRDYSSYRRRRAVPDAQEAVAIAKRRRDLSRERQLHKLGGLWFELHLAPWQAPSDGADNSHDVVLPETATVGERERLYGMPLRRAVSRRSLSGRELAAFGLANDPDV